MPLKKAVTDGRYDIAQFLIENGIRPTADSNLLEIALNNDSMQMIELLLPFYDLNAVSPEGDTPLFSVKSKAAAEFLIHHGAKPDIADHSGHFPYQAIENVEISEYLLDEYLRIHPVSENLPAVTMSGNSLSWDQRFTSESVSICDLVPVECDSAMGKFKIQFDNEVYDVSERFISSLARKLKFSGNIFTYFSAEEVLGRVHERNPDIRFKVTFDHQDREILGVVEESKKILPAQIACRVFSEDPRIQSVKYKDGIWEAEFQLDENFSIKRDSEYLRKILLHYPVDGVSMPHIYLSVLRKICTNGATALVNSFRTDIEINDESGTHLSRLLRSYNNENGFMALESRLQTAQDTLASVDELLRIENLLATQISDNHSLSSLQTRLEELAGDPCAQYETTSLNNIPAKKRPLIPVQCSVNDLFNFCSELTSHHDNLLRKVEPFNVMLGNMLSEEFDLEDMYHNKKSAKAFLLDKMELSTNINAESAARRGNTVL